MDPEKQQRLAKAGGQASATSGKGHRWTPEEAKAAGQKGGRLSRRGPAKPVADADLLVLPPILKFR